VAALTGQAANRNCVMNQEVFRIDTAFFVPGFYRVVADYKDGNSNATISGDVLKQLRVKAPE
jgi:hypothetical protein